MRRKTLEVEKVQLKWCFKFSYVTHSVRRGTCSGNLFLDPGIDTEISGFFFDSDYKEICCYIPDFVALTGI